LNRAPIHPPSNDRNADLRNHTMMPMREEILAKADALLERPIAFDAQWDGDSNGWCVVLSAIHQSSQGHIDSWLATFRDGDDLRLFNGQVPPWPEAVFANEIGAELAARFGVPFYFPSPNHPETDCPHWWERDLSSPCRRCGIPLLQRQKPCRWRGICYFCHLTEEKEKKEASWSPEDRAGPRCEICGNPARGLIGSRRACSACLDGLDEFECARCHGLSLDSRSKPRPYTCMICEVRAKLDALSVESREAIRITAKDKGEMYGIKAARAALGCSLNDGILAVRLLCQ
jgi:hypothetical protein